MRRAKDQPPFVRAPAYIRQRLDELGMTQSDFAMRMGRAPKVISETLNGLTSIPPLFALHCEYVLGIKMDVLTTAQMHEALEHARKTTNLDHIPVRLPWFNRYRRVRRGPKPRAR